MKLFPNQENIFQEVKSGLTNDQLILSQEEIEYNAQKLASAKAKIFNKAQSQGITPKQALGELYEANKLETLQDL